MERNELMLFTNEAFGEVRTVEVNGKFLFVANDVAIALGYSKPNNAINTHCKGVIKQGILTNGGLQELNCISEGDVYRLIVRSKLPNAQQFEIWLFEEVLPSIRKYGIYATEEIIDQMIDNPEFGIKLFTELKEHRQKVKELEIENQQKEKIIEEQKPKVDFADQVSSSDNCIDMKTMAKIICDKGIEIGRNRLFRFLREQGYLMEDNQPYQEYVTNGWFRVIEEVDEFDERKTRFQTLCRGKGQQKIYELVRDKYNGDID